MSGADTSLDGDLAQLAAFRRCFQAHGVVAQLVERLNGIQEVRGSSPLGSTIQQVSAERAQQQPQPPNELPPFPVLPIHHLGASSDVSHPASKTVVPSLGDAVRGVLSAKKASRHRPSYIASLRQYLTAFARGRECHPISDITPQHVEEWFAGRSEASTSHAANLGRLSALFSFAVRRGWIASNPCNRVEKVRIESTTPKILTPAQCRSLLNACGPAIRPWVVSCLFAGLRPSEAERLDWSAIRLTGSDPCLVVDAAASKVRRRRIVPLALIAVAWLALDARPSGPLVSSHSTMRRARREAVRVSGVPWSQDVLRHTHASMRLGVGHSPEQVAREMGNSPRILLTHYAELVQKADAVEFWNLRPRIPT